MKHFSAISAMPKTARRLIAVIAAAWCHPVPSAFELRIYPPGQRSATYAAFDLPACSYAGPAYLGVQPIVPGVGTVNG